MTQGSAKCIGRVLEEIQGNPPEHITNIKLVDQSNFRVWEAIVEGPTDTPYEGGRFKILIEFPAEFPFKPPIVSFNPPVYHPNVHQQSVDSHKEGSVSLTTQEAQQWSPGAAVGSFLPAVYSLLMAPNPDDNPAFPEAAALFLNNREEFDRRARQWTREHAQ
ncbi:unnamed protein product [Didymodactylos carnosus]|uniref:UBC core domain-containing protein n=1 Tax=Didymodactylos carnosus TaxID=1234261 RepID=A0A814GQC2_9BILA|nr:unnamed protein product [Didymodactylos carnosus]CAF1410899.1 unnamed protein product [Didymodactylos carnosus]CAF3771043.1 unnamed protein product [Didymodactylos carnosus]CAF4215000.1 unnamed protein product [Didymodactylos carnosus]